MNLEDFLLKTKEARELFEASYSHQHKKHLKTAKDAARKVFESKIEIEVADFLIKLAPDELDKWSRTIINSIKKQKEKIWN